MVSWRGWAGGLLLGAASVLMVACGGGGGTAEGAAAANGGGSSSGFSVSFDRSSVAMSYTQGSPETAVVAATAHGTALGTVYIGATTPSGQPDPNIDHVNVLLQGSTGATVTVVPKASLAAGNYSGTVVLQVCTDNICSKHYSGSPFNLAYTLTVKGNIQVSAPPTPPGADSTLQVNGRSLVLQGLSNAALSQVVGVTVPAGLGSFTVTAQDAWATVDQITANSFRVSVPARPVGGYTTSLLLQAGNTSITLSLQHTVTRRPLTLDTGTLVLGSAAGNSPGAAPSGAVAVTQLAEGASGINATVGAETPWLGVTNVSSSGFTVAAAALPSGQYSGTVRVESGSDTVLLPVSWKVLAPAGGDRYLSTSASSLTFTAAEGATSAAQTLGLVRPSWNPEVKASTGYNDGSGWLLLRTLANGDLQASADATGMAAGVYRANITLTGAYPSAPLLLPVSLTVGTGLATPAAQNLVLGSETTSAQLAGTIPVASNGAAALNWTATSNAPWLRLTRAAGSLGTPVAYQVDTAAALALPAYADNLATVTISAQSPGAAAGAAALTPVSTTITLRTELAEVHFVGPGLLVAGQPAEVFVRGRGFDRLADPAARLSISGISPTAVTRISATALKLQLPAVAAGDHPVALGNALGATTSSATLRAVAAQTHSAAALATGGVPSAVLHDGLRRQVFVANLALSAVQRWRERAGSWTADSLAFANLRDIGLSPDGAWLVATEPSGRLHLIDPVSFTISASYSASGPFYPTPVSGHGLAITNDGKVWLAVGTGSNAMVSFDLRSRQFTVERPAGVAAQFEEGPWFEVSRNGERKVTVQSASSSPTQPLLYDDASLGLWRINPADLAFFYWSYNGLDDSGSRLLTLGQVYDANFGRIGKALVPDIGWSDSAGVLSPDGRRLYVFSLPPDWTDQASTQMPRIYVFDTSGPAGTATTLPLLGAWDLPDYPTCHKDVYSGECFRPVITLSADGRTLLVAGSVKLLVAPVPAVLPNAQAARAGNNMRLWMR